MIAEDIVQSVFLKYYESFDLIKNSECVNFWIFKTARNEYYNLYKRNKRIEKFDEEFTERKKDEFELEYYVEIKEMKKIIFEELDKMENGQKEVYLLKEYGGLSYKEISETMNIDIDLVKSRLYKVRQKLINKISKLV